MLHNSKMTSSATYRFLGISLIAFCFAFMFQKQAFSQLVPQRFSYQAVIRDDANQLLNSLSVGIRLSILQGSATGSAVYLETHTASTSNNGLVSIQVGGGTVVSGALAQIDWASGPYFIKTETDPLGGTNYTITGTSQMLSVPYALFSANGTPGPQGPAGQTGATGPQGPAGDTGAQGPIGLTGPAGATGQTGASGNSGANGKNALIRTTPESAGTNCANGGVKIEAGLDADENGQLSDAEVNATQTKFLCNGVTGAQGPSGPVGSGGFVHYVGEQFGGGVVFHVYKDASGTERGLVVSLTNQSEGLAWSNITNALAGANSSWDGLANSNAIVTQAGHTSSAAKLCLDYSVGGFSDWYLPSKYELDLLSGNFYSVNKSLNLINGAVEVFRSTDNGRFCSSTEYDSSTVWNLMFYGSNGLNGKDDVFRVRAIRAFSVFGSVTDVDGNNYETVTIGTQVWMKENLKVSKYRNGDTIPTGLTNASWQSTTSGAYAIYNNDTANNTIYGKLYNWYAVADPRGLCPAGLHVPTDHDWNILKKYLDLNSDTSCTDCSNYILAGKLKSTGTIQAGTGLWWSPNSDASNESNFNAHPGGAKWGAYIDKGLSGFYWTSTINSNGGAWAHQFYCNRIGTGRKWFGGKSDGYSVRCLKN